jgi:succinyl-CoA synthetase beta subunit
LLAIVVCFDAKISFDDNAIFKHPELKAMRDITEENPREVEAEDAGLNYVGMDGNIGCLGKAKECVMSVGTHAIYLGWLTQFHLAFFV